MFRRSREVLRRAVRRIADALRRRITGPAVYSVDCAVSASAQNLSFFFAADVGFTELVPPTPKIRSEEIMCSLREIDTILDPKVEIETPPSEMEAEVVEADTTMEAEKIKDARLRLECTEINDVDPVFTKGFKYRSIAVDLLKAKLYGLKLASQARILDGWRVAATLPLKRKSIRVYRMPAEERVAYWRELVSQVGRQPKELELIGIFPGVPERGIRKVGLRSGTGLLTLWLDLEKARGARTGTMIIARERSSGRLYRVFDRRQ